MFLLCCFSHILTASCRSWHEDEDVDRLLKFREKILGKEEDIKSHDPYHGTAFERAGHCTGIGEGTRAYNLAVAVEQATQVAAPSAQGKGDVGNLPEGVELRQGAIRVR